MGAQLSIPEDLPRCSSDPPSYKFWDQLLQDAGEPYFLGKVGDGWNRPQTLLLRGHLLAATGTHSLHPLLPRQDSYSSGWRPCGELEPLSPMPSQAVSAALLHLPLKWSKG